MYLKWGSRCRAETQRRTLEQTCTRARALKVNDEGGTNDDGGAFDGVTRADSSETATATAAAAPDKRYCCAVLRQWLAQLLARPRRVFF